MECFKCDGKLTDKIITHTVSLEGCVVVIADVPVKVCESCGESYFANPTMKAIDRIVENFNSVSKSIRATVIVDYAKTIAA